MSVTASASSPDEPAGDGETLVRAAGPGDRDQGRIVSGAAAGARTGEWLTPGQRRAKTITNCVTSRWGDGPDTPAGVRDRATRANDPPPQDLPAQVDDETIAVAIRRVQDLERRWVAVPPDGKLRPSWPLGRDFFAGAAGSTATSQ